MNIYQRKGVWYIDKYPHVKGPGRRQSLHTSSKEAAKMLMRKIENDFYKTECLGIQEPQKMLFDNLCVEYLAYCDNGHNTAKTMRRKNGIIKNHLTPVFSGRFLNEISVKDIELYKQMRRQSVSQSCVNRELACIKHMFTYALHVNYLKDNTLRYVKNYQEPAGRTRYLTEEEEIWLLTECPNYIKPIAIAAIDTGMRKGEILGLLWCDIDLKEKIITVRQSKNNEPRLIPMTERLHRTLIALGPEIGTQYVFCHGNGKPYLDIRDGFRSALRRAGIENFRFHDLRHTCATRMLMKGVDVRIIQAMLGQKTISMTIRYTHVPIETLRAAVDKLRGADYNSPKFGTHLAHS